MAATAQQQLDAANDSLLRILQSDAASMTEEERSIRHHELTQLNALIERLELKTASQAGRQIIFPVRRVNA